MTTDYGRSVIFPTGYWGGNDPPQTLSIPLSDWIIRYLDTYKTTHIYDFGCSKGMYLDRLIKAGFTNLCGYEGDPPDTKVFANIIKQDLTMPFFVASPGIVISLEVAEHIPSEFTEQYLTNIHNACMTGGIFIASWAVRGQGGHGHCNELNNDEAIKLITAKGFIFLEKDTKEAREIITDICDIEAGQLPWFKNTTLIFRKI